MSYLDVLHGYKKMPQTWVIRNNHRYIIYTILKAGKSKIKELASEKRLHDTLSCGRKQKEKREMRTKLALITGVLAGFLLLW